MEYELPITIVMELSENCRGTAHGGALTQN